MLAHPNVINDTVLPEIDSDRGLVNPIAPFTQDYDQNNGIISTMTPSVAQPESTLKRKAMSVPITAPTLTLTRWKHCTLSTVYSSPWSAYVADVSIVAAVDSH